MTPARRIIIVEDQRQRAADLDGALRRIGYDVAASVSSQEDAVQQARTLQPDLILVDSRLRSTTDGIAAAEDIRTDLQVPIIDLCTLPDEDSDLRMKATAPFGYLAKSLDERDLRAAIEMAILKNETQHELALERTRRRAAEEFKRLVENVKEYAIYTVDVAGRITSWNEGARRIKGYTASEILGKHVSAFYPETSGDHAMQILERAAAAGSHEEEGFRVRKNGTQFWASVVITALRDPAGAPLRFAVVTRDMTEQRRAREHLHQLNEELERAVQARDEFLSIASHELRSPLQALHFQLHLLRELGLPEFHEGRLARAMESTKRLGRLIDRLLDISRISLGELQLTPEPFDLCEAVAAVVERFDEQAARSGGALKLQTTGALAGEWDRLRIEQVVVNLLDNALKYGAGGPVEIGIARREDEFATISVRDHGPGISAEDMERIFGRFERAVAARRHGGLGLGLYITQQIVQAHGGTISVEAAPGGGSVFLVDLPCRCPDHAAPEGG